MFMSKCIGFMREASRLAQLGYAGVPSFGMIFYRIEIVMQNERVVGVARHSS